MSAAEGPERPGPPDPQDGEAPPSAGVTRRAAMAGGAALTVGAGLFGWLRARGYEIDPPPVPLTRNPAAPLVALSGPSFDPRARQVLEALLGHLMPGLAAAGLPSALEAGVLDYVEKAARLPGLRPVRNDILKLCRFLDSKAKPARFHELDAAVATQLLFEVQEDLRPRGRFIPGRAIETTLRFALEGYLGHPHHGGNPDFVTWKALDISMPRQRESFDASGQPTHHHHGSAGRHQP